MPDARRREEHRYRAWSSTTALPEASFPFGAIVFPRADALRDRAEVADLESVVRDVEKGSRGSLVGLLKQLGFEGTPVARVASAKVSPGTAERARTLTFAEPFA